MVLVANGKLWRSISLRSSEGSATRIAVEPSTAIGRSAAATNSPARLTAASEAGASLPACAGAGTRSLVAASRDILRQIEMHRSLWLAERQRDRVRDRLGHASPLEPERCLGDRLEQRVVVDPHLYAPAELIGVEV